jgi:hypothetical protein
MALMVRCASWRRMPTLWKSTDSKKEEGLLMRTSNVRWMLVIGIWVVAVALIAFQVMSG